MNKVEYVEEHGLGIDYKYSGCGLCALVDCGYYFDECPQEYSAGKLIVTNAFSGNMINVSEYSTVVSKISEEEFLELIKHADSNISHPGIARRYHLPVNQKYIQLVPGDEVLVVYIHGGRLPSNGKLPWNVHLSFERIRIESKVKL